MSLSVAAMDAAAARARLMALKEKDKTFTEQVRAAASAHCTQAHALCPPCFFAYKQQCICTA
ncbi:hypothetical protein EON67_02505 [archaeon]|nr:MAG: hypothetical protein EON67_02505 [archaeon]